MRKNLARLIIPALLLAGSISHAADKSRHYVVNDAFYGHHHARPDYTNAHDDWFSQCSRANEELARAQSKANRHARQGRLAEASIILKEAIIRVADGDLSFNQPAPGTHLAFAAEEAKKIIDASDSALISLPEKLRVQVDYLVSNGLMQLLESAYTDLDDRYVRQIDRRCGDCFWDGLPDEYFDGVRALALRFVELQLKLQERIPTDLVEMKMAKAISSSATNFLEAYTRRRRYCRALNDLIDVRDTVCEYLENPSYPSYEIIPDIRQDFQRVKFNLSVNSRNCD